MALLKKKKKDEKIDYFESNSYHDFMLFVSRDYRQNEEVMRHSKEVLVTNKRASFLDAQSLGTTLVFFF